MCEEKEPLLVLHDVCKQFKTQNDMPFYACRHISFSLHTGETIAIVGESGSGKSTLMKMIMGLLPVSSGTMTWRGQALADLGNKSRHNVSKDIQMVYQNPLQAFNPRMTVKDILQDPLRNYGLVHSKDVGTMLHEVGLSDALLDRYPHEMSGGQCQRVAIARALALNPSLLILDEATSALDMSVQDVIMELLVDLQRKRQLSYLFVCHDMGLAYAFAHRILVMKDGVIVDRLQAEDLMYPMHPYTKELCSASIAFYK